MNLRPGGPKPPSGPPPTAEANSDEAIKYVPPRLITGALMEMGEVDVIENWFERK